VRIIYFHGGPGFNGNPERNTLLSAFQAAGLDLRVWDEPSLQRPKGPTFQEADAFKNYLDRASDFLLENYDGAPVVLIGHSFGAFPVCHLSKRHPDKIFNAIIISSDLGLPVTDKNTFTFTMLDFKEHEDPLYLELQKVLERYTGCFDKNTEQGFNLIVQNPRLFDYYWFNKERMRSFVPHYSGPEFSIDVPALMAVRRSLLGLDDGLSPVPALALFGRHDIVVTKDVEVSILREHFSTLNVEELSESAHYPQVEELERVIQIVQREIGKGRGD
jgi:pimeloyl-ACP methyl ester carboxylesterase